MRNRILCVAWTAVALVVGVLAGCGGSDSSAAAGFATGRVTMADGKPLAGDIKDIAISIYGVTEAGQRVTLSAVVKPDGTYRQKLTPGQYSFEPAKITVVSGTNEFSLPLEPVGNLASKNRDSAEPIEQDFVWKTSGVTPYGQSNGSDIGNARHWYGMSIGMRLAGYREDKKAPGVMPPVGTKLIFTIKPVGKGIDGSELQAVTVEREFKDTYTSHDINDLVPGDYEVTGVAAFPDGTTRPLVFQGDGNYPDFVATLKAPLAKDGLIGGMAKQLVSWSFD